MYSANPHPSSSNYFKSVSFHPYLVPLAYIYQPCCCSTISPNPYLHHSSLTHRITTSSHQQHLASWEVVDSHTAHVTTHHAESGTVGIWSRLTVSMFDSGHQVKRSLLCRRDLDGGHTGVHQGNHRQHLLPEAPFG